MKTIAIEGTLREELGSKNARQLRREGLVPCVLYGGEETIHFSTPDVSFKEILFTPEVYKAQINLDGKTYEGIIRDVQYHPVTDETEHVDFFELLADKPIVVKVPVQLKGNARGVRNGGRMKVNLRKLRIKATPDNLPGSIDIDVENLRIGQTIRVEDIAAEGFEIMHEPFRAICLIQTARTAVEDVLDEEEIEEGEEGAEGAEGAEASAEGSEEETTTAEA